MKKNTKEYMEALEMMEEYFGSLKELDILECGDEEAHLNLANGLALLTEGAGSAKHVSRMLAGLIWGDEATTIQDCAREFLSMIPAQWSLENLDAAIHESENIVKALA